MSPSFLTKILNYKYKPFDSRMTSSVAYMSLWSLSNISFYFNSIFINGRCHATNEFLCIHNLFIVTVSSALVNSIA